MLEPDSLIKVENIKDFGMNKSETFLLMSSTNMQHHAAMIT